MAQTKDTQRSRGALDLFVEERGIVGWLLVLIVLGIIFAIWLVVQALQAII